MKTVKLGTILENAARLAGRQVAQMGVPDNWKALAALSLGEGFRRIAAEKFPMMQRVEYRRYRPEWLSNVGWTRGQECWYGDDYWRLEAEHASGAPGSCPEWVRVKMSELVAFIEWEQPWEPTAIDKAAVDVNRFAYLADPKQNPMATPVKVVGMNELGVTLQAPAPKGVYVKFTPKYPNVSFIEWAETNAYETGDVVYLTSTKECYQAVKDVDAGGTSPAEDVENWQALRISDTFESFLTRLVAVDFLTEDQGKYQTRAAADKEFDDLCERYHEGNGECRVRTGRFMR